MTPTPRVKEFIATSIRSLDELHALVTCARARQRWWNAADLRQETGMALAVAERVLENLARRNLFDIRIGDALKYRFSPSSSTLADDVVSLLDAYYQSPVAVTQLVAESMNRHLVDFSEAFRLRRDDSR